MLFNLALALLLVYVAWWLLAGGDLSSQLDVVRSDANLAVALVQSAG